MLATAVTLVASTAALNSHATETLNAINVTATRTALTADETLAAVTVINQQEIESSQSRDLVELLDGLPGLSMSSNGGFGKNVSIRLRGTDSKNVLVLIDGIRAGSATLGTVAWQDLPLSHIGRIEVVRGPRSHLYGSDAIGGVIQIFTLKGQKGLHLNADAGYGTHNTVDTAASISGGDEDTRFSLRASHFSTDGFSALENNNPDNDGYENNAISGNLSHQFTNGAQIKVSALRATGNNEYDSSWGVTNDYDSDIEQQVINGQLLYSPSDSWDMTLMVGETRDRSTNFENAVLKSTFNTKRRQASWQNDLMVGEEAVVTLGLDFLRDEIDGSASYTVHERDNTGLFGQYQNQFDDSSLTLGLRYDDNDSFGGHTTGNIAYGYDISSTLRLIASYGTAFNAPTFNDLYYQDPWGSNGNPDLEPEESKTYELGLVGESAMGHWDLRLFRTEIDDLIDWIEVAPWTYQPQNVNQARIDGLEFGLSTTLAEWKLAGSLTLLDPTDKNSGKRLTDRSKQTLRIDLDRKIGKADVGVTWRVRSDSYSDADNTKSAAGFGTVDLRVAYPLGKDWSLRGQVRNLTDKDYQTIRGYNTPGRELFLSVVYKPVQL
ncbi:hypothetical protein BGP75_09060 [Motiliproteus sp. MSK22-1]|nr:hypothetical protein BGP75_09060 [Motiliproteus sp. MSK22-1]